jgi:hypothetical protein
MRYYQDYATFQSYMSEYDDDALTSEHYFYFKTSTLDSFIRECIITPLKKKYDEVGKKFNQILIRAFKLDQAFQFVRKVYFMEAGREMFYFGTQLFDKLDAYNK